MALRTFNEIVVDLITYALRKNNKIDVTPGQVLRDVVIDAPASEMATLYNEIDNVRIAQSLLNAAQMTTADMNNLASNYGIVRKSPVAATGRVIFYSITQPTSDYDIPAGTRVSTEPNLDSDQIIFSTTTAAKFFSALEASYYNPDTGYWEIEVPIQAEEGGARGNVGTFAITRTINFDSPFRIVNRISTTGGSDQESNVDLAARVLNTFTGNNKGTKNGYEGFVKAQASVLDALVVGPGDDLMTRDGGQGGKVDIWTYLSTDSANELTPKNEPSLLLNWDLAEQSLSDFKFYFPFQPLETTGQVIITATTGPNNPLSDILLLEYLNPAPIGGVAPYPSAAEYIGAGQYHYKLNKSNNLNEAQSIYAGDNIEWNWNTLEDLRKWPSGTNTGNFLEISITYPYNQTINDLQTLIDDPDNKIITADVLVKEAIKMYIDVQMNINISPNYKTTNSIENQTIGSVVTAITDYINSERLGQKIEKSDLVQIAHEVAGVDNIVLSSIVIQRRYESIYEIDPLIVENIQAGANEYFASGNIEVLSV